MKSHPIEFLFIGMLLSMLTMLFSVYGNLVLSIYGYKLFTPPSVRAAAATVPDPYALTATASSTHTPTRVPTASATFTPTSALTATPLPPSETATLEPTRTPATPTETPSLSERLRTHIVFFLISSSTKHHDACGDFKLEPIISKRMRTGDKLQDVQIALNMLFSVSAKYYGPYYNALWDTHFTIESTEYIARKDYMIITFGGYFPFTQLSTCDKQGIRQQIWTTFFYYGFREKTFKYYDKYLIDRLGGG